MFCVVSKQPKGMYDPFFIDNAGDLGNMINYMVMVYITPFTPWLWFPFDVPPYAAAGLGVMGLLSWLNVSGAKPPAYLGIKAKAAAKAAPKKK